ncbi:MAG: glycine--tRNA ligase subunit beta [Bacillota bacterium]|jgi:glycyl-tRNA synthetase beta chain
MNKQDLLFELGVEEIPARFLPSAIKQLQKLTEDALLAARLPYDKLNVWSTPRRLVIFVSGLAEGQTDSQIEAKGPSLKAAYDEKGQPTKALLGFCRGQGVSEENLSRKELNGNIYLYANKIQKGQPTKEVLPQLLLEIVNKIYFPKPMRWGYEEMRFARPIHWVLALLGEDIIPLTIAGQTSSNISMGHRVFGSDHIKINRPDEYTDKLADNFVIVDQQKREQLIWQQIEQVAQSVDGQVKPDCDLLTEINFLLEYPTALIGSFDDKYLDIPEELVITPMKEHQRYFPVYDKNGRLMARFVTVRNGDDKYLEIVAAGNEKVLEARLADAEFFWKEDLKKPLRENLAKLSAIVFHEKLGTMAEKVQRVSAIAAVLAAKIGFSDERVKRAASLMKGDLPSLVVGEFPELQGIMGEYYALHDGEDREVAQAIREHYLPRFAGDDLPETMTGRLVAIADKLDSLLGFFAMGMQPTGSQDPYALRRAANGVVQIIVDKTAPLNIELHEILAKGYDLLTKDHPAVKDQAEVSKNLTDFLGHRLENILTEQGIRYDVVNAIAAVGYDNLTDACKRAKVLEEYREKAAFSELLLGFTRAANLLKNAESKKIMPADLTIKEQLLQESSEKILYHKYLEVKGLLHTYLSEKDYPSALETIASLREPIDNFFVEVMVMVQDEELKNNRLALLNGIVDITKGIGDLSQIVN